MTRASFSFILLKMEEQLVKKEKRTLFRKIEGQNAFAASKNGGKTWEKVKCIEKYKTLFQEKNKVILRSFARDLVALPGGIHSDENSVSLCIDALNLMRKHFKDVRGSGSVKSLNNITKMGDCKARFFGFLANPGE